MFADIDAAVEFLVEAIKTNYRDYTNRNDNLTDINLNMIDDFENGVAVKKGNKYIKVTTGNSVWGFVVNTDKDKKFRKGDILLAASWAAPARNAARGNVFEGYQVKWTGPLYLK